MALAWAGLAWANVLHARFVDVRFMLLWLAGSVSTYITSKNGVLDDLMMIPAVHNPYM